ncbi:MULTISPECIES: hypothetical protein [Bacillus cereus group]|uniref:hypothetical protein n=1 Tax=Bacillus cereus group TaxID=86661 RepID=UPI001A914EE8|nr:MULTISPECIES: hypothetical protein [Bacillus cereus group]MDO6632799.1 hypothetical protein [Bacillus thuringiensis]MDO6662154.1 hypothetical protein [Bacillus thuringiensis]MDO6702994.1 hypothetical protein [Bacillus thuringiensis]
MNVNNLNVLDGSVNGDFKGERNQPGESFFQGALLGSESSKRSCITNMKKLQGKAIESNRSTIENLSNYETNNEDVKQAIRFYIAELEEINEELSKPIVLKMS